MNIFLIDSHFHLNYLTNYPEKITHALQQGVCAGLIAGVWNEDTLNILNNYLPQTELFLFHKKFPHIEFDATKFTCFLAHGLHPAYIHLNYKKIDDDIIKFKHILHANKEFIWAIGETGFDLSRDVLQHPNLIYFSKEQILNLQNKAFDICVEQAIIYDLPLIIHSRSAWNHTLNKLKEAKTKGVKNIMIHCYSGPAQDLKKLETLNIFCSFGGVTTWKNAPKVKDAFMKCHPNLRLLETDSPDLSPDFDNGEKPLENEPSNLIYIAKKLSGYLNCLPEDFILKVNANFTNFLLNRP